MTWKNILQGFCLLAKLIEESADDPAFNIVDLGLGAEEYKERFANQTRETFYVTLRNSVARHAREILRYRAAEVIKSSPWLEQAIRAAIMRVRELWESVGRDGLAVTLRRRVKQAGAFFWSEEEILCFEWVGEGVIRFECRKTGATRSEWAGTGGVQVADDKLPLHIC